MDPTCRFCQDYLPVAGEPDPVLDLHLSNCEDCRDQSLRLDA